MHRCLSQFYDDIDTHSQNHLLQSFRFLHNQPYISHANLGTLVGFVRKVSVFGYWIYYFFIHPHPSLIFIAQHSAIFICCTVTLYFLMVAGFLLRRYWRFFNFPHSNLYSCSFYPTTEYLCQACKIIIGKWSHRHWTQMDNMTVNRINPISPHETALY